MSNGSLRLGNQTCAIFFVHLLGRLLCSRNPPGEMEEKAASRDGGRGGERGGGGAEGGGEEISRTLQ